VIPHPFRYLAPETPAACVAALADGGRVLAGGTWVLPELSRAESQPDSLVDLKNAGLRGIHQQGDLLTVGAMCTYAELLGENAVARHLPLLHAMAGGITGGWALRNQATIGGSAAAARPQSDVPAALVASEATVRILGPAGETTVPALELFVGAMTNCLDVGEIVTGFTMPSARAAGHGYVKIKRGASSWPIGTCAALLWLDEDGRCARASVALGGIEQVPLPIEAATVLVGQRLTDDIVAAAAQLAIDSVVEPWSDVLAPASYRRAITGPLVRRALTMARNNARPLAAAQTGAGAP
jgi:carbon-monoxide dehydrogenase medium subunit